MPDEAKRDASIPVLAETAGLLPGLPRLTSYQIQELSP